MGGGVIPLELVPITLREACAFVTAHHRHHSAPRGCRFVGSRWSGAIFRTR